ncbi:MAG: hypothetical protein HYX63_08990 [Gammaproteobacteria bacterium]|nr:hypothetical protein [Gammaproteobacteria bacterium]
MRANAPRQLFGRVIGLLDNATFKPTDNVGYPRLAGLYAGLPVQVLPVVDTLAVRRLPALWLLVTLQARLPIAAKLDLMMRPNGATTFSNFDLLSHTLELPAGFPEYAVLRTDDPGRAEPGDWLTGHLDVFDNTRAKELLITAQGLRFVWLLAEAERARYGVFRQAEFGPVDIDPALLKDLLERLLALRASIMARAVTRP